MTDSMKNHLLFSQLLRSFPIYEKELLELRVSIEEQYYYYGNHFRSPFEKDVIDRWKQSIKYKIKLLRFLLKKVRIPGKQYIISGAYFNFNQRLIDSGMEVIDLPLTSAYNGNKTTSYPKNLLRMSLNVANEMKVDGFYNKKKFFETYKSYKQLLSDFLRLNPPKMIIVPNDMTYENRILIDIAKQLGIKTAVFLHGLPGYYSSENENKTDYLLVWGEAIRNNFINIGHSTDRIKVVGHPLYSDLVGEYIKNNLRNDLSNPLVISKSMNGAQFDEEVILSDRSNLIVYLLQIKETLLKLGVHKARLRCHPSENPDWYIAHLGSDFYEIDKLDLQESLNSASIVIGASSTLLLESLISGVNYIVFEPRKNGKDLVNYKLVPPFDGSDNRVVTAHDVEVLFTHINDHRCTHIDIIKDYVSPFYLNEYMIEAISSF